MTTRIDSTEALHPFAPPSTRRDAPLRMDADEFRRVGHALVDAAAEFLANIPAHPLTRDEQPSDVQAAIGAAAPLPEHGTDAVTLLGEAARVLFDHSLINGHPRFFGYITSSPAHIGILGDLLAATVNANVGAWRLSPAASEIESQAVRWIAELVGYPPSCGGLFVSGGNMANMVGLFAARAAAADWDVRARGVNAPGASPLRVYASAETHTWLHKATDLAGLGTDAIRWIRTDEHQRMNVDALRLAIEEDRAAGARAMMVVATAGTVSTGAVDPLAAIAGVCRDAGIWLHVDGAYGALAAAVGGVPADLGVLHLADSVAVDPHKWLYAPLEAGCVLVREVDRLRAAFAYHPPYYRFGQAVTNFVDLGPQNSRGFRALRVWLALRQAGRAGYVRMIGDDIRLSERLWHRVKAHEELEAVTQSLSITTFRYIPARLRASVGEPAADRYLDALNEELVERIQTSGEAFLSNAVVGGRYLLRACIVNFNTTEADIDLMPEIVVRLGREADEALRGSSARDVDPR